MCFDVVSHSKGLEGRRGIRTNEKTFLTQTHVHRTVNTSFLNSKLHNQHNSRSPRPRARRQEQQRWRSVRRAGVRTAASADTKLHTRGQSGRCRRRRAKGDVLVAKQRLRNELPNAIDDERHRLAHCPHAGAGLETVYLLKLRALNKPLHERSN